MAKLQSNQFDEEFQELANKTAVREPCKRCTYNEAKLDGSRKRRRFSLEEIKDAPESSDIIGYTCDVGIKSLLRSICEFYQLRLRGFLNSEAGNTKMHHEVVGAFVSSQILEMALEANKFQHPFPTAADLSMSLVSLLSATTNLSRKV
jgi:hypothetical protein